MSQVFVENPGSALGEHSYGEWVVRRRLGGGGMGVVHLATRGNKPAALKSLQPGLNADPTARKRFEREIVAGLKIDSPHVASIIDYDLDLATPYVAWQFIDGLTLKRFIESRGPLDETELHQLAQGLAAGIAAMAGSGVSHRDLKPSNILMSQNGPVIVDLGIAALELETTLTDVGQVLGSPCWMAPEQLAGTSATGVTDVFGWGALMHFAATGSPPFGGGSSAAVMYRIAEGRALPHPVEGPLGVLIDRSLAPDPAHRPSPSELVSELTTSRVADNHKVSGPDGAINGAARSGRPINDVVRSNAAADRELHSDRFVGRRSEMQLLCGGLTPPKHAALWCIEGPAGVGKTRLLQEVAAVAAAQGSAVFEMAQMQQYADPASELVRLVPGSLLLFDNLTDFAAVPGAGSLELTIRTLLERGVVIMGTLRSGEMSAGHPIISLFGALDRRHTLRRITLTALDDADADALYRNISGLTPPEDLLKRSGGNPLLVCQLAREAELHRAIGGRSEQLPLMALELLGELSDSGREVATIAACSGERFRIDDLKKVITNEVVLHDGLEECLRGRILAESADGEFAAFTYGVLRDHLAGSVCSARRRTIAASVAATGEWSRSVRL